MHDMHYNVDFLKGTAKANTTADASLSTSSRVGTGEGKKSR